MEILQQIFELCVIPLLGILTTYLVKLIRKKNKELTYAGTLWVDDSVPHKTPDMYLELDKDVEEVTKAKVVHLKVVKR